MRKIIKEFLDWFLGGIDNLLCALFIFVIVSYIMNEMCLMANKKFASVVALKNLLMKIVIFILVGIANILDTQVLVNPMLRVCVILFYISDEGIKILSSAADFGLPIPEKLKEFIRRLHKK